MSYFPNANAVAVYIRLRIRDRPDSDTFLIVEGKTDRAALSGLVAPSVTLVPASNKEKNLGSRAILNASELERCTFLVDCDGELESELHSAAEVVVSDWRDLDADMALHLEALPAVIRDHLSEKFQNGEELSARAAKLSKFIVELTTLSGTFTDAARSLKLPVRYLERRVRISDTPGFADWAAVLRFPKSQDEVLAQLSEVVGWSRSDQDSILGETARKSEKLCRRHGWSNCGRCLPRTYVNGHDLIGVLQRTLDVEVGRSSTERELTRQIRLSVDRERLDHWGILKKMAARELDTQRKYLAIR